MPKVKTNRAASKRFKRTKNGKYLSHKQGARHLMNSKSPKRRRLMRRAKEVASTELARIKVLLPYS
jgi:large subunit ribosomal protein L35